MDKSRIHDNIDENDDNPRMFKDRDEILGLSNSGQLNYTNLTKFILLGAEKMLMARKPSAKIAFSSLNPGKENEEEEECTLQPHEKACKGFEYFLDHSTSRFNKESEFRDDSRGCHEVPFDIVALLTMLVLKLADFQIGLILRFFSLPICFFNIWLTFITFPFRTMIRMKNYLKKTMLRMVHNLCSSATSFICSRVYGQKSMLHLAIRFCRGFFWSIYVCSMLLGLLISGFIVSYITMSQLLEEPIKTSQTLNFDYTKTSPVAFIPVGSSAVPDLSLALVSKDKSTVDDVGKRFIPYDHKLRLTVSLTLPESEYNRNLGIFQVRVETLSANGKATASASYPTMLRFKSQPIRFTETIFKTIPLIAGVQSEVQNLQLVINDFTEGLEPTACFKVILEQRAQFQSGAGIPETYSASLDIESELPQLKRIVWSWRRTIFVWISIYSFLFEFMVVFIFCRPIIFPGGRENAAAAAKKSSLQKKISI